MHEFSTVDGFVEITESLAEMIKYVANEPSVGLFYVQQHNQNAVPNIINLKNNVAEKSCETNLHTADVEDSMTMLRSMKECGLPIVDDMVRDIRKSLTLMSTRPPRRGLIDNQSSGFLPGRTRSWGPVSWAHSGAFAQHDTKGSDNYLSTVLKTAREKASNFKWPQPDAKEVTPSQGDELLSYPTPLQSVASAGTGSSVPDVEIDELPLSSYAADELQMPDEDEQSHTKAQPDNIMFVSEYYDYFKADQEAKLKEWLGETGNKVDKLREIT